MKTKINPKLFIHVPKTAGTSFNTCAEEFFGLDAMEKDYGADADHTSALIKKYIYGRRTIDLFGLFRDFSSNRKKWLTGHFNADRYVYLFGCQNTLAFVRKPVDRVISEYLYRVRKFSLDQPFEEFYRAPDETNKQFVMIGQFPWQAFELVGTQERYNACLELVRERVGLPFENIRTNERKDNNHLDISDETRADIAKWNERDGLFYNEVNAYLGKQFAAHSAGKAFCFHDIGFVPGTHAIGWAFYRGNEMPVDVALFVDDKCVSEIQASEHRQELQLVGAPRMGNVGFRFVLTDHASAEKIEIKATETGQTLLTWRADQATS